MIINKNKDNKNGAKLVMLVYKKPFWERESFDLIGLISSGRLLLLLLFLLLLLLLFFIKGPGILAAVASSLLVSHPRL